MCDPKKQSTTADSSTTAEVAGSALAYPGTQCASNTFEELGFPQPTALGTGSDSQSTVKLLQSPASKGKTRHLDLRHSTLRMKTEHGTIRLFYTPTEHMIADTGTKALAPAVLHRLRSYLFGHIPVHFSVCSTAPHPSHTLISQHNHLLLTERQ